MAAALPRTDTDKIMRDVAAMGGIVPPVLQSACWRSDTSQSIAMRYRQRWTYIA